MMFSRMGKLALNNQSLFRRPNLARQLSMHGVDVLRPHIFMLYCDPLLQKAAERENDNPWGLFSKVDPKNPTSDSIYARVSEMFRDKGKLKPAVLRLHDAVQRYMLQCEKDGIEPKYTTIYGPQEEEPFPKCIVDAIKGVPESQSSPGPGLK
jgi:hypothetical protein